MKIRNRCVSQTYVRVPLPNYGKCLICLVLSFSPQDDSSVDLTTASEGVSLSNSISILDIGQIMVKVADQFTSPSGNDENRVWRQDGDGEKYYQLL
jgi:hypothetical protein